MTYEPNDEEARREKALERLGIREPECVECGITDWKVLELHHVAGKRFDATEIILCANCHKGQSDVQKDHPPTSPNEPPELEKAGRFMLGLADFLATIVAKLRQFGHMLLEAAKHCPWPYGYGLGGAAA